MQVKTLLKLSIAAAIATIAMKSMAWWVTDSVGLLSDALESFVNLASALFALGMVTIAQRPADEDHTFGHTKAEYFSSGFEGLLIAGAAAGIIWAAVHRFSNPQPLESLGVGLALAVVSSALNGLLAQRMMAASREHRSIVLEADARHLYTDVLTLRAWSWAWSSSTSPDGNGWIRCWQSSLRSTSCARVAIWHGALSRG